MSRTIAAFVHSLISPAVEDWFTQQCVDPSVPFYAYYRKTDGVVPGAFCITQNKPGEGWLRVAPERVRIDLTKQQVQNWLYDLSRMLEILPYELDLAS